MRVGIQVLTCVLPPPPSARQLAFHAVMTAVPICHRIAELYSSTTAPLQKPSKRTDGCRAGRAVAPPVWQQGSSIHEIHPGGALGSLPRRLLQDRGLARSPLPRRICSINSFSWVPAGHASATGAYELVLCFQAPRSADEVCKHSGPASN